jgi:PadR family transcriptional regulator, regulatory protein PadR
MSEFRLTRQTLALLRALVDGQQRSLYGYDLMRQAELKSGTLYPILARLERLGHLTSEWETIDPVQAGRPARRVYALTPAGRVFAGEVLPKAQHALRGGLAHA